MLHQSRLQLSLGLDAETPIDLRSWGYGEESGTGHGQGEPLSPAHAFSTLTPPPLQMFFKAVRSRSALCQVPARETCSDVL